MWQRDATDALVPKHWVRRAGGCIMNEDVAGGQDTDAEAVRLPRGRLGVSAS